MTISRKVTLIGTGLMGVPMTRNLLKAGHQLTVWNRTIARAEPLAHDGARIASSEVDAVTGAEFVITMLSDGFASGALIDNPDVQAALSPGAIWIDMSSAKPEHARQQAETLTGLGFGHLDAPVSGGTKGAEAGTLAIMVGGKADRFEAARAVFEAMGRPVHVGPSGAGQLSKLANQTIVAVTISAVAEAMLLVEQGGANPAAVRAALKGGFADSVILQQHGERMSEGNFEPGGLTKFQVKDLNNTLDEAASLGLELPATESVRDRFQHFIDAMDGAEKDHSGLYLELKARNGLNT
ncbi:2-hydroxy-3-oxopropionate reductase [Roseobacter fucihabitans]|uniref:2-hydroxy-3-oxopropionate reductase n=1 Tax=Roseobacter fucihabitans TaxID=1537242 RepID=A0ABZ2BP74_9RHOB|nr:NAD(P)-dependent oxidoreductase [Roseobacter litoralis]MBC6963665.1 2-hydroxy-3-oxopropionate reductase [Roseobacter litoralis]